MSFVTANNDLDQYITVFPKSVSLLNENLYYYCISTPELDVDNFSSNSFRHLTVLDVIIHVSVKYNIIIKISVK